jgi:hypothetical protein
MNEVGRLENVSRKLWDYPPYAREKAFSLRFRVRIAPHRFDWRRGAPHRPVQVA